MSTVRIGSARSVLLTVLGELVEPIGQPVWTSSLRYVLSGMGFEDQAARQAIDRAADAGWIAATRFGRNVRWELTASGKELIARGAQRVHSLNVRQPPWSGHWLVLFITVPNDRRSARKRLYAALSWAGFGNPTPGLWLSPHADRQEEAAAIVEQLELQETTLAFVGPSTDVGLDDATIVRQAWDLDRVAASYTGLLDEFAHRRPPPGDPLLFAHLALVNEWQRFPFLDPQLPNELLGDWIGHRASKLFEMRRAEWTAAALSRWQEVTALTAPGAPS